MSVKQKSWDLEAVVTEVKSRPIITEYLEPARNGGYCCIGLGCTNGRGKHATGANLYRDNTRLHCHVCGGDFSNIDVIAHHLNLSTTGEDFIKVINHACAYFGIYADWDNAFTQRPTLPPSPVVPVASAPDARELELIRADISKARAGLDNLPDFARRGLSLDTLCHFRCGFLANWSAPKARLEGKKPPTSRRLIIPTSDRHYLASAIDRRDVDKRWWKMHAGSKEIFNSDAVSPDSEFVLVVEGEIDAMSIWQATGGSIPVIAIGGAAGKTWIDEIDQIFTFVAAKPAMLVLFDDDDAGRKDAPALCDELRLHGYPSVFDFLPAEDGEKLDANDFLLLYGEEKLSELVRNALKSLQNAQKPLHNTSAVRIPIDDKNRRIIDNKRLNNTPIYNIVFQNESEFFLSDFEDNITQRKKFAARKTGFSNIDARQIFLPGLYVLGGLPSIGKTTFAWQLLEQCADAGEHCFYLSYEMTVHQLRSKTLARELWLDDRKTSLSASQISVGGFSAALHALVEKRQQSTRNLRAAKLTREGLNDVLPALEEFCAALDKPPIVVFDYLQCIPFAERERRDGIANNVRRLKDFQLRTNATILALSSLNRDNYSAPISFESFKETGEIEYSADVLWGLQLYCVNRATGKVIDDRLRFEEAKQAVPRQMQLKCVKNREGSTFDCFFNYFAAHDHFEPCAEEDFKRSMYAPMPSTPIVFDEEI